MNQLHIALLSTHSCPWAKPGNRYTGGMNIYIQNMARKLVDLGHHVDIFTCSHPHEQCTYENLSEGIRLIHINTQNNVLMSNHNLDINISNIADSIIEYSKKKHINYDLVHSHYWLSGLVGNIVAKSWNIPHVTMFHTLATLKNNAGIGALESESRIAHEKEIIQESNLIVASTQNEKNDLVIKYSADPSKIAVIPCGIDTTLFRSINKNLARKKCNLGSEKIILFVGRMDPLKGLANLLEAISLLMPKDDFRLLVIGGENKHEKEYRNFIHLTRNYNIVNAVEHIGSVKHDHMYLYYNAADFCVIPSFYESFSLVALESLACGIPVLSTNVGNVKDMVEICKIGRILEDNSPANMAHHIENMLAATNKAQNGNIKNLYEHYGWDMIISKLITEYDKLIYLNKNNQQPVLQVSRL